MSHLKITCVMLVVTVCLSGCGKDDTATSDFEPVEPALTFKIESPEDDPTARDLDKPDPNGEAIRKRSLAILVKGGFHAAGSLPTAGHRRGVEGKLRPAREVAQRLMALDALFTWTSAPESAVKTDRLLAYIKRNDLKKYLTEEETAIISLPREQANQQHAGVIGWKLENMWALAWVLGFETAPDPMLGQIPQDTSKAIIMDFLPGLDASIDDLLKKAKPRSLKDVSEMEDVFYCSHNAVRSAQTGSKTSVPKDFHPVRDGGAIHERRHSLTWSLSPGTDWEDTDLST